MDSFSAPDPDIPADNRPGGEGDDVGPTRESTGDARESDSSQAVPDSNPPAASSYDHAGSAAVTPNPTNPYPVHERADSGNPYQSPTLPSEAGSEPILMAEVVLDGPDPRPRWWTPLAVSALSLAVFLVASFVMALVAIFVVHGEVTVDLLRDESALQDVSRSRLGLLIIVVLPQFALVAPSVLAAVASPESFRNRLGLVRGHWPVWAWLAVAAATPLVGLISGLITGMFLDESESLKEMSAIFRDHGQSGFLLPLAMMIGATPAICEELLFRGYVQTRLARSLGPLKGILIASALFAAFHMDFVHVIAVFPLGLFLGWVAWRSGSIFPAMLGHFVNNVISVVAVVLAPEDATDVLSLPSMAISLSIIGAGIMGMGAVLIASVVYGRPQPGIETASL